MRGPGNELPLIPFWLFADANNAYEGAVALQDGADTAMGWFVERVAAYEPSGDSGATSNTPSAQVWHCSLDGFPTWRVA